MKALRVLIVDDLHPYFKEEAEKLGYEIDDQPEFTRQQTLNIIGNYDGLAIRTKFLVDKEIIDHASNLKFIARAGAGMDNIDEKYAGAKGIVCINAPEGNRDAVAEHAMAMLLSLTNNLFKGDNEIRNGVWDREGNRGWEIKGKTVGIIGYGNTGRSFARKISGFDVSVLAYDKYHSGFSDRFATEASMDEIREQADILSLHIPLTDETRQMINDNYFNNFKKQMFFVNTSRGEIASTWAVLNAINNGKLLGAALDVLEVEKFPHLEAQSWFAALKNENRIILSPHVAGWTFESYSKISEVLIEKLKNLHF
jgi:D-3-phosphoglycerate dehydrogenase / 2-oxoglutarate reductase